ncbi:MAG: MBL fold metallo-hydrolase [Acidimicrobiales bacterium]|nr:MBL fold metallo-hydrolase [Acidimicrobiales bacterium]
MILEQYYLQCLSQASYLIGDQTTGRAVVVDPRRDIEEYLQDAKRLGVRVELVLETHLHADFLSGHLEFAQSGAEIGYGSVAQPEFPARLFEDGERYCLGQVTLEVLHTPGHTPESISIAVYETPDSSEPHAVLTGDTLFVGDVGRPDLLVSSGWSKIELAGMLYDSLHGKLLTMPDDTIVYPAHGAGSACGKNLSSETWSTIGVQRKENGSIRISERDDFVASIIEGQPSQPMYFAYDAQLNAQLRPLRSDDPPETLRKSQVEAKIEDGAVVLDVRDPATFALGHLPGSINVGLEGRFAEFAGSVVDPTTPMVLCGDADQVIEAQTRLSRIGYDQVVGAFAAESTFREGTVTTPRYSVAELRTRLLTDEMFTVLDVRNPGELEDGAIEGSLHIPLAELVARIGELAHVNDVVIYCAGGYRSSIAASVLRYVRDGIQVSDLVGGFSAWDESN